MTPKEVVSFAKENGALMIDFKFMDFVGIWQHFSVPMSEFDEDTFEDGLGFDGSSIRGWQPIHASDMIIIPDPKSAKMDPFTAIPTLSLICNIFDPKEMRILIYVKWKPFTQFRFSYFFPHFLQNIY